MANCNICNKEIQEGYICAECAKNQRPAGQTAAAKPGSSGFSLNNLLKPAAPLNPAASPASSPLNSGGLTPPRPAPTVPPPAVSQFRSPATPPTPQTARSGLSETHDSPTVPPSQPQTLAPSPENQLRAGHELPKPVIPLQTSTPTAAATRPAPVTQSPLPPGNRPGMPSPAASTAPKQNATPVQTPDPEQE